MTTVRFATPVLVTMLAANLLAQSATTPSFEVVSVRANTSNPPMQMLPTLQPGGRVFAVNLPLRELIRVAYGLRDNQVILESPLSDTRFDLEARAGTTATREQATMMLRALLAGRFGFKAHPETRQLPVYMLQRVSAERLGPQIRKAGTECAQLTFPSGPGAPPPPPPPPAALAGTPLGPSEAWAECPSMFFPGGWSLRSMSMHALALALERLVQRAVIDKTGLPDVFDIDLSYAPDYALGPDAAPPTSSAPSLVTALREQLGLRLEPGRAPVDVLVVDEVQQPTEN